MTEGETERDGERRRRREKKGRRHNATKLRSPGKERPLTRSHSLSLSLSLPACLQAQHRRSSTAAQRHNKPHTNQKKQKPCTRSEAIPPASLAPLTTCAQRSIAPSTALLAQQNRHRKVKTEVYLCLSVTTSPTERLRAGQRTRSPGFEFQLMPRLDQTTSAVPCIANGKLREVKRRAANEGPDSKSRDTTRRRQRNKTSQRRERVLPPLRAGLLFESPHAFPTDGPS